MRFLVGKVVMGQVFTTSAPLFSRQYHSISDPNFSSSTCCPYQKDEREKPGDLPENNDLSQIMEPSKEKYFFLFVRVCYSLKR
jgi:hypothetical protein